MTTDQHDHDPAAPARRPNRLAGETSPYLLQHAHNPVDWHPWGEEAFAKARSEGKPLLVSIGYSACHWCHVMERESFENPAIAELINRTVVPVKVDREERPDVDAIYMNACVALTGQGGWPLNAFVTPDLKPFFVGTYFPPDDRHGRAGFGRVLERIGEAWEAEREQITRQAEALHAELARAAGGGDRREDPGADILARAVNEAANHFDIRNGGFGGAPKFPPDQRLALLLAAHHATGSAVALRMTGHTLEAMALGGMYDQLGGGFARYSVDAEWRIPHFEKMLYNQALLVPVYLDAHLATGAPMFRAVAAETLDWVLRDLRAPEGVFFSALDADSEGEEGKYYVWTPAQVEAVLGKDDAELFRAYYDVTDAGNFEHGTSAPRVPQLPDDFAEARGMTVEAWLARLDGMKRRMLAERATRVPPGLDDKAITAWNGLMITALARGWQVLGDPRLLDAATAAAEFILERMRDGDGRLLRVWCKGTARIGAMLEDHAYLCAALVDLYESAPDARWLDAARSVAADLVARFHDRDAGGFFTTDGTDPSLISRGKETHDGALPAAASVAAQALFRIASLTDDAALRAVAESAVRAGGARANMAPGVFASLVLASRFGLPSLPQVVVAGDPAGDDTRALLRAAWRAWLPARVIALAPAGADDAAPAVARGKTPGPDGRARAYLCAGGMCRAPVDTADALAEQLRALAAPVEE